MGYELWIIKLEDIGMQGELQFTHFAGLAVGAIHESP